MNLSVYSGFWIHEEKSSSKGGVILGSIIGSSFVVFLTSLFVLFRYRGQLKMICWGYTAPISSVTDKQMQQGARRRASISTEETAEFINTLGIALRRQSVLRQRSNLVATIDDNDFGNFSSYITPDGVAEYLNRFQNQVTPIGEGSDSDADFDIQEHENSDVVPATGAVSSRAPVSTQLNDAISVTSSKQM
eukprot:CAMPEP_0172168492 /NCGR_PEP_ID=MMETSP1050-20130122/10175_1 /TAXON_ID=233186 /ORGANISM="Cryptomonas curvata, Strain CCAP979/52" /LENGTH=190 /DNA_ID=CAMNT_0012839435 /DNA_START=186 /DNA_END=758 /DNA_ORIENTATION=+